MRFLRILAGLATLVVFTAASLGAQTIELRGRGTAEHDRYLRQLLRGGEYQLIDADTLVARNDTIHGTALVIHSVLRLEGVITGDLVIVDGNVFVRPTARVLGDMRNIGGGLFYSELADVTGVVRSDPDAPYRAERRADGSIIIRGTVRESALLLYGFRGIQLPTYDRVDGLTLGISAGYAFPLAGSIEPIIRGHVERRFERSVWTGGGELALARRRTEIAGGAERTTITNERWIKSDIINSIASLVQARDRRDYYDAERGYVEFRRQLEATRPRTTSLYVRGQVEDAKPLAALDPWSFTGDFRDDNIVVADSRITSAIVGTGIRWATLRHALRFDGAVEFADEVLDGDYTFGRFEIDASWAMQALANHTLTIRPHVQGPLPGTDSLPHQRWSFVGGDATLYTFGVAQFRGDRVAFVETEYAIPLPAAARLPLIGRGNIDLLHMVGMAWTYDDPRSFEQNVGIRLRFPILYLRFVTNPSRFEDDAEFAVGAAIPRRSLPWQP